MDEQRIRFKMAIDYIKSVGIVTSQRELAKALGVHEVYFSKIANGVVAMSDGLCDRLKELAPDLNTDWLRTGEGEMLIGAAEGSTPKIPVVQVAEHIKGNVGQSVNVGRKQSEENEALKAELERLHSIIDRQQEMLQKQLEIISRLAEGK